ncbi:MAG TPA: lipid-binding SYLF domain-containing protein [Steroidobacteraceae bacterium]|nr:lipid-binding SYLF domain-containing protein [Steroidobacteraceae bacterium]
MNMRLRLTAALVVGLLLPAAAAFAQSREDAKLIAAAQVLQDLHTQADQRVPTWLLNRSYGVAVVPDVLKGAFIVGGRHGTGVLSARDEAGRFSNPVFIALNGGSFGFQAGAEATDVVLVFASKRSLENFARGQVTLGATASVAAGPIGRQGEAAGGMQAEVYSYSHARGLFVGVALDGTALTFSSNANRSFYGQDVTANQIFGGQAKVDSEPARRFIAAIVESLGPDNSATPGTPAPTAAPAPAAAPAAPAAPAASGAQTFPMEDPKPGTEPK